MLLPSQRNIQNTDFTHTSLSSRRIESSKISLEARHLESWGRKYKYRSPVRHSTSSTIASTFSRHCQTVTLSHQSHTPRSASEFPPSYSPRKFNFSIPNTSSKPTLSPKMQLHTLLTTAFTLLTLTFALPVVDTEAVKDVVSSFPSFFASPPCPNLPDPLLPLPAAPSLQTSSSHHLGAPNPQPATTAKLQRHRL
jgi:hypothetical protein